MHMPDLPQEQRAGSLISTLHGHRHGNGIWTSVQGEKRDIDYVEKDKFN